MVEVGVKEHRALLESAYAAFKCRAHPRRAGRHARGCRVAERVGRRSRARPRRGARQAAVGGDPSEGCQGSASAPRRTGESRSRCVRRFVTTPCQLAARGPRAARVSDRERVDPAHRDPRQRLSIGLASSSRSSRRRWPACRAPRSRSRSATQAAWVRCRARCSTRTASARARRDPRATTKPFTVNFFCHPPPRPTRASRDGGERCLRSTTRARPRPRCRSPRAGARPFDAEAADARADSGRRS